MTFPAFILAALLIGFFASLFHLIRGGNGSRWLLYFVLSAAGFATGQWLASARGWHFLVFGPLELGAASIGSYVFLGIGDWLTQRAVGARKV